MFFMLKLEHFVESLVCALISAKYMFRRILYRMQAHSIPEQHTHTLIILSKFCAFQLQPRTKLFYAHPETQKHRKRKKKTTQYIYCATSRQQYCYKIINMLSFYIMITSLVFIKHK